MEISELSVLAKLPRPQGDQSKIHFSEVYGLTNGLKRRRQELCAAVDGDSINIYEVRHGRNLSSYTVPPDSSFSCPPRSIHTKAGNGRRIRNTYYTTIRRSENRLTVVQEELDGASQQPIARSVQLENSTSRVIQLETLPVPDSHGVIVIREDGHFEIWNAELSSCTGRGKCIASTTGARLVTAQWLTLNQIAKSLLKARPDITALSDTDCSFIVAMFDATTSQASSEVVHMELGIWRLPRSTAASLVEQPCESILSHKVITSSPLVSHQHVPIAFAFKETRLVVKTQTKTQVFDLTSTDVRQIQEFTPTAPGHISSIAISDTLMLSSTSASLSLYNTRFQSLQTKLELHNKSGTKRKRANQVGGPVIFLNYFTGLNRIIAIRRDVLVAIDLQALDGGNVSSATKQTSLLVNNIGRGASSSERLRIPDQTSESSVARKSRQSEAIEQWQTVVKQLDQLLREKDFDRFENVYLEQLTDKSTRGPKESQVITSHKLDYAISKIFDYQPAVDGTTESSVQTLKLAFPAHKVLQMLAVRGLLSIERIARVIRANARSSIEFAQLGTISQILTETDSTLVLLYTYLEGAPYITCYELVSACLLLLRRAVATVNAVGPAAITRPQPLSQDNNGSTHKLEATVMQTDSKSDNINDCLRVAIERLADTEDGSLSRLMRKHFTQGEVIALIQFLRQQLFHSGYTRSLQAQLYPSPPCSDSGSSVESKLQSSKRVDITLPAIAYTLSSCIDAIGPIGVLGFGDEEEFIHSLIPELSSEISKATEALQDATFVRGMLRETLRFVESTARTQAQSKDKKNSTDVSQSKLGTIATLYAEPGIDGDFDQGSAALPLSLRAEGKISALKVRKGDGRTSKRSEREMGMRQDRLRGPYALERLTL